MIFGVIIEWLVGLTLIGMGVYMMVTHKPSLLHDYHYQNVKPDQMNKYTMLMGISIGILGVGIVATGFVNLFCQDTIYWLIPLVLGICTSIIMFSIVQKKYNGGWFN